MLENDPEFDLEPSFKRESQEYHLITGDNRAISLLCSPLFLCLSLRAHFTPRENKEFLLLSSKNGIDTALMI